MRLFYIYTALFVCFALSSKAQAPQKQLQASRLTQSIKLDGKLNEIDWSIAPFATDFIQNDPIPNGKPSQKSEIRILYDDQAVYIGAMLYDTKPDSILQELSERDNVNNTDWFGIMINAYQDGQNAQGFYVTAAGVQVDMLYSASSGNGGSNNAFQGDRNWDTVWGSEVAFTDEGWIVEMRLPYAALRFPNKDIQEWNINFGRMIRRDREQLFWNEVDPQGPGFIQQAGVLKGIENIKAPVRLSATPFVAGYAENYFDSNENPKSSNGFSWNAGMDIKYGINDAFTLDMTLIPDFGEAISDNQVQNLSAFEIQFDENRQFFTEGIELFNKGNLFYSRRIGGQPINYGAADDDLGENEEIIENPYTTQLYNATKVSGRTKKGLGIGVFNAIAGPTEAIIENMETGNRRTVQTSTLTNYNVFVLDQNLKNNSFVTLLNTNVMRSGSDYDANVTSAQTTLRNKDNSYAVSGSATLTQKYFTDETDLGHAYNIGIAKTSGNYTGELFYNVESYDYDPNDLGFLFSPNERQLGANVSFRTNEEFWKYFNSGGWSVGAEYNRLDKPNVFRNAEIWGEAWVRTKAFTYINMWAGTSFLPLADYFDPRTADFSRYYELPEVMWNGFWASTDYRKRFAIDFSGRSRFVNETDRVNYSFEIRPRFRFNNKFTMIVGTEYGNWNNDVGYVDTLEDGDIIFGRRDRKTLENTIRANYAFNNKMTLSFRLRHYWANVSYKSLHLLGEVGNLLPTDYNDFSDNSFNAFNIDAIYRWRFAPGSDIFIIWKNSIFGSDNEFDQITYSYGTGLDRLFELPQRNSLSIKVIYFLDYLSLAGNK